MYDHIVQETFGTANAIWVNRADLLSKAGFLVAAFNSRGAGRSGGHGGASAATETADYESIITRLLSYAEQASVQLEKLYICVFPLPANCRS
jgi:alpha-beta hydrolase superfamily lysophospholipase